MSTYTTLASFAQTVGLLYFVGMFLAIAAYASGPATSRVSTRPPRSR